MKFSVVIPVFNGVQTIVRTVDAVLAQTLPAQEVIIVDDASTDDTCALIIEKYGNKVSLLKLPRNSGSSAARNAGTAAATGDFIAYIDADDVWHRDKLLLMDRIITSNPSISFLFHRYTLANVHELVPDVYGFENVQKLSFARLLAGNVISTSCALIRNDKTEFFNENMRYAEDYDLWLRIAYRHGAYLADVPLTQLFRPITSAGGISSNRWQMRIGEMKAYAGFATQNPIFLILLPLLVVNSLLKHLLKMTGML